VLWFLGLVKSGVIGIRGSESDRPTARKTGGMFEERVRDGRRRAAQSICYTFDTDSEAVTNGEMRALRCEGDGGGGGEEERRERIGAGGERDWAAGLETGTSGSPRELKRRAAVEPNRKTMGFPRFCTSSGRCSARVRATSTFREGGHRDACTNMQCQ
jgi:hypothetical protein